MITIYFVTCLEKSATCLPLKAIRKKTNIKTHHQQKEINKQTKNPYITDSLGKQKRMHAKLSSLEQTDKPLFQLN